jgi:hypothetical protein
MSAAVLSQLESVSTSENVSPPNFSADSVSSCKIFSKNENWSTPENLKTTLKISQVTRLCHAPQISQAGKQSVLKFRINTKLFQAATTIGHNVGSYTQGRIAGDFLSSRNAARAERCTPKTTAAALDG